MSENVVEGINSASTLEDLIAKYDEAMKGKGEFTEQLEAVFAIESAFAAKLGAFYVDKDSGLSSMSEDALKKMSEKGGTSAKIAAAIQKRQEKDRNPQSNKTRQEDLENRSGYKNENEAGPQRESFMDRLKQKYDEVMQKVTNLLGGKREHVIENITDDSCLEPQKEVTGFTKVPYKPNGYAPTDPKFYEGLRLGKNRNLTADTGQLSADGPQRRISDNNNNGYNQNNVGPQPRSGGKDGRY